MTVVEKLGERLARRMDRRRLVSRSAAAMFGLVAAWATEGIRPRGALAYHCSLIDTGRCYCRPVNNTYCTNIGTDAAHNCVGADCYSGHCTRDLSGYPSNNGCWCTQGCNYGSTCGYYQCCDCICHGIYCGCRQFVSTGPICPYRTVAGPDPAA